MKTRFSIIAFSILFTLALSLSSCLVAQYRSPVWLPAHAYRAHTRQIYFPEYNCYYDVQRGTYIYFENGRWLVNVNLPIRFRSISLRRTPYIELSINAFSPERYNDEHRVKYRVYRHEEDFYHGNYEGRHNERRDRRDYNRDNHRDNRENERHDRY